jgi:hypothetical protein
MDIWHTLLPNTLQSRGRSRYERKQNNFLEHHVEKIGPKSIEGVEGRSVKNFGILKHKNE